MISCETTAIWQPVFRRAEPSRCFLVKFVSTSFPPRREPAGSGARSSERPDVPKANVGSLPKCNMSGVADSTLPFARRRLSGEPARSRRRHKPGSGIFRPSPLLRPWPSCRARIDRFQRLRPACRHAPLIVASMRDAGAATAVDARDPRRPLSEITTLHAVSSILADRLAPGHFKCDVASNPKPQSCG